MLVTTLPPPLTQCNSVYLLVDDMGYANTEINNPEAITPNIKALAASGESLVVTTSLSLCSFRGGGQLNSPSPPLLLGLYLDRFYVYRSVAEDCMHAPVLLQVY